jgi:hypothetical protein
MREKRKSIMICLVTEFGTIDFSITIITELEMNLAYHLLRLARFQIVEK